MATQADPTQVFCQLLHDSLTSQTKTSVIVPESAAPSTTTTMKSTKDAALSANKPAKSTGGIDGGAVSIIVISLIAMCLFCITAYLVFRTRSLSRRLKSQASEQQHNTVITNNVTEHSNNVNSPFNIQVSMNHATDHSSGFDGVHVDYDDTALANSYEELRRDNCSDGQYMELGENLLPSTATNGIGDYNYI
ncbi:uncharacterized protein LOC106159244 [Lingula anatina]|uniref:Uncharacterized protein LOC106159244 n=1 Tax=Lingula anatina TaxID=7574 RepID=A0A1S3I0P0_LINAN|nr:uncharacterized protein LOC106159244 [Lingula anatina]|eukprot:XP_013390914.1 uncharacterized protein LOC106159244 [Lingula anatina]